MVYIDPEREHELEPLLKLNSNQTLVMSISTITSVKNCNPSRASREPQSPLIHQLFRIDYCSSSTIYHVRYPVFVKSLSAWPFNLIVLSMTPTTRILVASTVTEFRK